MKFFKPTIKSTVIPAQAGIQVVHLIVVERNQAHELDSRLRGNDDSCLAYVLA